MLLLFSLISSTVSAIFSQNVQYILLVVVTLYVCNVYTGKWPKHKIPIKMHWPEFKWIDFNGLSATFARNYINQHQEQQSKQDVQYTTKQ